MPKSSKRDGKSLAAAADKYRLYEMAVQCPAADVDFVQRVFRRRHGRPARRLREDFCGTAAICCEWVRRHRDNTALGIDTDARVLAWCRRHHLEQLAPARAAHVQLLQADVMQVQTPTTEVVLAMNFSYWLFKERASLRSYFEHARACLQRGGMLFLDACGGSDAYEEGEEETRMDGFTYVWDQHRYNPIDGSVHCHIHFRFRDGSELRRAFSYQWRLWSLPELCELLREAGFTEVTVYWEGTDRDTEEGNGRYRATRRGTADPSWIAYIVAENG